MIRNDREGIQIELKKKKKKKKSLRTPYAYNMNRAILQSVSRNLFYIVSFEKKRKKRKRKKKRRCTILSYCTRICFRLGPFEINVKFVITIVSL